MGDTVTGHMQNARDTYHEIMSHTATDVDFSRRYLHQEMAAAKAAYRDLDPFSVKSEEDIKTDIHFAIQKTLDYNQEYVDTGTIKRSPLEQAQDAYHEILSHKSDNLNKAEMVLKDGMQKAHIGFKSLDPSSNKTAEQIEVDINKAVKFTDNPNLRHAFQSYQQSDIIPTGSVSHLSPPQGAKGFTRET